MYMRRTVAALAVAAIVAGPAAAADLDAYSYGNQSYAAPLAPAAAIDWTGIYIGAQLGYGWTGAGRANADGFLAGGTIGGNWQTGSLVLGAEVDAAYSGMGYSGVFDRFDLNWIGTARARLGLAFDRFMVFGTGGFGWSTGEYQLFGAGTASNTHTGWAAGLGAEMALTSNISARVDYLHLDLSDKFYPVGPAAGQTIGPNLNLLRAGVNYRF